jgi:hypothetical protein
MATSAAPRAMGVRGRLAPQSWEANSRTNDHQVAGSADPIRALPLANFARICAALPVTYRFLVALLPMRGLLL